MIGTESVCVSVCDFVCVCVRGGEGKGGQESGGWGKGRKRGRVEKGERRGGLLWLTG